MRYQIAIFTLLGVLAGCSDSDAPGNEQQPSPASEQTVTETEAPAAPAEPKPQTQPEQPANVVLYECNDGSKFEAELVDQGVMMVINDISYDLRQQPSESGTLYADDTTSFLIKDDGALLTNEQGTVECNETASPKVGGPGIPEPPELSGETPPND